MAGKKDDYSSSMKPCGATNSKNMGLSLAAPVQGCAVHGCHCQGVGLKMEGGGGLCYHVEYNLNVENISPSSEMCTQSDHVNTFQFCY